MFVSQQNGQKMRFIGKVHKPHNKFISRHLRMAGIAEEHGDGFANGTDIRDMQRASRVLAKSCGAYGCQQSENGDCARHIKNW
jgi:hypothetical protein